MEKIHEYDVIIEQDEDGVYVAHVPELPGCHTEGDTIEEVLANIKEAIELYVEHVKSDVKSKMKLIAVHKVAVPSQSIVMKLKPVSHKKLIKVLDLIGYKAVRQKGSHVILEHKETKKITVVPARTKDIGIGLLSMILKEVGLSREEYFKLLEKIQKY